jgi:hypothetical protein
MRYPLRRNRDQFEASGTVLWKEKAAPFEDGPADLRRCGQGVGGLRSKRSIRRPRIGTAANVKASHPRSGNAQTRSARTGKPISTPKIEPITPGIRTRGGTMKNINQFLRFLAAFRARIEASQMRMSGVAAPAM